MDPTSSIRILLAEDEIAHAAAITRAFEVEESAVVIDSVASLAEYRAAVAENIPDLALVDMNLPDGSAVDILTSPPEKGAFPIVIMTSQGNEQTAVKAIKAGAMDYLVKTPESFASMPHVVQRTLREWRLLQSHRRAEAALLESQEIFLHFMEHSPIYVFFKDANGRPIHISKNFEIMLGRPVSQLLGRDMTEIFPRDYAERSIAEDRRVLDEGIVISGTAELNGRHYSIIKFPVIIDGKARFLAGFAIDITDARRSEALLLERNAQLEKALASVKTLSGLLPICSGCKKIRDDKGYWSQVESYIQKHSDATFTHGFCPECAKQYFPGVDASLFEKESSA